MNIPARDVPRGRFFVTADDPPDNIFVMRVPPAYKLGKATRGRRRAKVPIPGLCQRISDSTYWHIQGNRFVRLLREDEHDKSFVTI